MIVFGSDANSRASKQTWKKLMPLWLSWPLLLIGTHSHSAYAELYGSSPAAKAAVDKREQWWGKTVKVVGKVATRVRCYSILAAAGLMLSNSCVLESIISLYEVQYFLLLLSPLIHTIYTFVSQPKEFSCMLNFSHVIHFAGT